MRSIFRVLTFCLLGLSTIAAAADNEKAPATAIPPGLSELLAKPGVTNEKFADYVHGSQPLSPEQIEALRKHADAVKRASERRPYDQKIEARSLSISLASGQQPKTVRLAANTVSTLVFQDVTGAPWPVESIVVGNKPAFEVTETKETKTHVISVNPLIEYASGNLAVMLQGAPAPILLMLDVENKVVDVRLDINVEARGPNAERPMVDKTVIPSLPPEMISMLDGITPQGAKPLRASSSADGDVRAWLHQKGRVMLRTRATLLSPAAYRVGRSADGMTVYDIPETPVAMVMLQGQVHQVSLSGF